MTDFRTPPAHEPAQEPGPQPDPMLQTGRRSTSWIWLFAIAILAVVAGTLYGINNQEPETAANEPAATQAQSSGGETTGAAPKEEQADQQDGKGDAAPQKTDANKQGAPANAQNNPAPQNKGDQTNQKPKQQ